MRAGFGWPSSQLVRARVTAESERYGWRADACLDLRDIGISRFDVDASAFDPDAVGRATRPDRAAALKAAHQAVAHDRWFREQVQQALDDPRASIPDAEVSADFASRRAALRDRLAGKRGDAS